MSVLAPMYPRPSSDKAKLIGKRIRWLLCTVKSTDYLRVCDVHKVDQVFGDGRTTVTVRDVTLGNVRPTDYHVTKRSDD